MPVSNSRGATRTVSGFLTAVALMVGALGVTALPARADTAPESPETVSTVSADSLPTVQIDGVVWDQVIVGSVVYVTGKFTYARPAGAAPGTSQSARSNALAYDVNTGVLKSWAPVLNAQGMSIEASADGSRIFIGGDFTTVNKVARNRLAAVDPTSGAVVSSFAPDVNGRVRAMDVSGSTLYLGGGFTAIAGEARTRLAAVSTTTGALAKDFHPTVDREVQALTVPPGKGNVVVAGSMELLNGVPTKGMGSVDAIKGTNRSWAINQTLQNYGLSSGILSLSNDGDKVYGTGFDYKSTSPFEGTFAASASDGAVVWINSCQGDTYDAAPVGPVLYSVGHAHNCVTIGGHPQTSPLTYQRTMATTTSADGVNSGGAYNGKPKPRLLAWTPFLDVGTYTGKSQAAWTVTGNSKYVVLGGEFPKVNGAAQQGLARFAVRTSAPNKEGPRGSSTLIPTLLPLANGAVRIAWTASYDRDNRRLTYEVLRGSTVIATIKRDSSWWDLPLLAFTDLKAPVGASQSYRVRVKDALGNSVTGAISTVTPPSGLPGVSSYAAGVLSKGAWEYWRFGETSGTTARNWASGDDVTLASNVTRSSGAILGDSNGSASFPGTSGVPGASSRLGPAPSSFSIEAWIKTTSRSGGKVVGFGNSKTGESSKYDRQVYLDDAGHISFGVSTNGTNAITSPSTYNNGAWHHVVATLGSGAMNLYVDGALVASKSVTKPADLTIGYWRIGGDKVSGWSGSGSSGYFNGQIDDVAIYPTVLTKTQVVDQRTRSGR